MNQVQKTRVTLILLLCFSDILSNAGCLKTLGFSREQYSAVKVRCDHVRIIFYLVERKIVMKVRGKLRGEERRGERGNQ